jgi:hypothetical protein
VGAIPSEVSRALDIPRNRSPLFLSGGVGLLVLWLRVIGAVVLAVTLLVVYLLLISEAPET